jgi:antitoxin CptB
MHEIGKLKWRCRRGVLELDLLLAHYLESVYPSADDEERNRFCELLELEDMELLERLTQQEYKI